jgi:hypothetical protein
MEKSNEKTHTGKARAEYIEVEPNVRLHITDAGEGRPIVLIHGWPLSDEMYEYQYNALIKNNFRAIGITLGVSANQISLTEYIIMIFSPRILKSF